MKKMERPAGLESVVGYQIGRGWGHTEDDGFRSSRKCTTSPLTSYEKLEMASGVDFLASGYCFKSRLSNGRGGRTNKGGYDLFVVVVVVTVFVSTHSARSI